jgi:hypothetical protein
MPCGCICLHHSRTVSMAPIGEDVIVIMDGVPPTNALLMDSHRHVWVYGWVVATWCVVWKFDLMTKAMRALGFCYIVPLVLWYAYIRFPRIKLSNFHMCNSNSRSKWGILCYKTSAIRSDHLPLARVLAQTLSLIGHIRANIGSNHIIFPSMTNLYHQLWCVKGTNHLEDFDF